MQNSMEFVCVQISVESAAWTSLNSDPLSVCKIAGGPWRVIIRYAARATEAALLSAAIS